LATTETPRILLIVGSARSGSTLAGTLAGRFTNASYLGELIHFWDRGLALDHLCGCEQQFSACSFWNAVVQNAGLAGENAMARHDQLHAALKVHSLRRWNTPENRTSDYQDMLNLITRLYESAAQIARTPWLVDSSKHPIYARLLVDCFGADRVHVLHLVRDPRGVAYSAAKKRPKIDSGRAGDMMTQRSYLQSGLAWLKVQVSAEALRGTTGTYQRIKYEQLCEFGAEALMPYLNELPEIGVYSPQFKTDHTVSGNPARLAGFSKINADTSWRNEISGINASTVAAITLPFLIRYGYANAIGK